MKKIISLSLSFLFCSFVLLNFNSNASNLEYKNQKYQISYLSQSDAKYYADNLMTSKVEDILSAAYPTAIYKNYLYLGSKYYSEYSAYEFRYDIEFKSSWTGKILYLEVKLYYSENGDGNLLAFDWGRYTGMLAPGTASKTFGEFLKGFNK